MRVEAIITDCLSQLANLSEAQLAHEWLVKAARESLRVRVVGQAAFQVELEVAHAKQFALHRKEALLELLLLRFSDWWLRRNPTKTQIVPLAMVDHAVVVDSTALVKQFAGDEESRTAKQFTLILQVALLQVKELHVDNSDRCRLYWTVNGERKVSFVRFRWLCMPSAV